VAAVQQLLEHGLIGLVPAGGPAGAASNAVGGSEGSVATGAEGSSKLPGGGSSGGSSGGLSGGWGSSLPNWLVSKQPHPLQVRSCVCLGCRPFCLLVNLQQHVYEIPNNCMPVAESMLPSMRCQL
jgi:hypothetical protein